MEKDNKILLIAILILLVSMSSFKFFDYQDKSSFITGKAEASVSDKFADSGTENNGGVELCGSRLNCGLADDVCPEDFFGAGVSCYIEDPDCCKINRAGWSSSPDQFTAVTEAFEGQRIYMYVETDGCAGKDADFTIYSVDERFFGADTLLDSDTVGPFAIDQSNKVSARWTAFTDPAAVKNGITKFKFKVKINPELFSDIIEISLISGNRGKSVNSCNDGIDNDVDGCADEEKDCEDGQETNQDQGECSICTTENGIYTCSGCIGWKCNPGDCLDGKKTTNCPDLRTQYPNCPLTQPPKFVKCYEKVVPFPFYDNFNLILSILSLIGYYGFTLRRKNK